MFQFRPAIYRNETLYELPRPILALRVQEAWDFEQLKVLLVDGDVLAGHSRKGIDIALEGQLALHAGALRLTEEAMFNEYEALREVLHVSADGDRFELFLYHDDDTETYRKFKRCSTVRFDADLSSKSLFTYTALIHAEDPAIYDTPPGE